MTNIGLKAKKFDTVESQDIEYIKPMRCKNE